MKSELYVIGDTITPVSISIAGSPSSESSALDELFVSHILRILKAVRLKKLSTASDEGIEVHGSFEGTPYTLKITSKPWKLKGRYHFYGTAGKFKGSEEKWSVEVGLA